MKTLFDPAPGKVRRTAPETSKQAAEEITDHTPSGRIRVLRAIVDAGAGGLTDQQIQDRTGLPNNSECPRRKELEEQFLIRDSGMRRATRSGRKATVWVATAEGKEMVDG